MRLFWLTIIFVIFITCLGSLYQHKQTTISLLSEIEPVFSLNIGAEKSRNSKCHGRVPSVTLPKSSLTPSVVALIVNDEDPQSVVVANYYQRRRNIPAENVIHVHLPSGVNDIDPSAFKSIKKQVDAALDPKIQAIALSFSRPFRVGCMSITSAFTLGYDDSFCQQQKINANCRLPRLVPYYNSDSVAPFTDLRIRPSMMLAGENIAQVKELIDRGVLSDETFPKGDVYLLTTTDRNRSTRSGEFVTLNRTWNSRSGWTIQYLNNAGRKARDFISDKSNILFYFTGLTKVPQIETNTYLPGAIADHLTSVGGVLFDSPQMSVLNWLKAGVTASYGTVTEPCNFTDKFPNPEILVRNYYKGQTLVEAYWKSVASPQEGVFVGEPLAKPMGVKRTMKNDYLSLKLSILKPWKTYQIYGADSPDGIYLPMSDLISLPNYQTVEMNFYCDKLYYKLVEDPEQDFFSF